MLSDINAPLRQLMKSTSEFVWDAQHDAAFKKMKELITREAGPVLTNYDPSKSMHQNMDWVLFYCKKESPSPMRQNHSVTLK